MRAIEVDHLTKTYRLYDSPRDRLREFISLRRRSYHQEYCALDEVSLHVEKGQTLGVIGRNGSGKSTLLKILAGVVQPSSGSTRVNGRVSALLELGGGFVAGLSGRENVYIKAALNGFTRREINAHFDEIAAFAEIGEFMDRPVRTYSSGMYVRLAFAVAVNVMAEVLLIDEVLSVGDTLFQAKCLAKLRAFQQIGITVLLVSHDLGTIAAYCERALLLEEGRLIAQGETKAVIDEYNRRNSLRGQPSLAGAAAPEIRPGPEGTPEGTPPASKQAEWTGCFAINPNENRYGSKAAEILEAGVFNLDHDPIQTVVRNQVVLIRVKVRHHRKMPAATVFYTIRDIRGLLLCGASTFHHQIELGEAEPGDVILVTFTQKLQLNPGGYLLSVGAVRMHDGEDRAYDKRMDYLVLQIVAEDPGFGIFDAQTEIDWVRL